MKTKVRTRNFQPNKNNLFIFFIYFPTDAARKRSGPRHRRSHLPAAALAAAVKNETTLPQIPTARRLPAAALSPLARLLRRRRNQPRSAAKRRRRAAQPTPTRTTHLPVMTTRSASGLKHCSKCATTSGRMKTGHLPSKRDPLSAGTPWTSSAGSRGTSRKNRTKETSEKMSSPATPKCRKPSIRKWRTTARNDSTRLAGIDSR